MLEIDRFSNIVAQIYDASLDIDRWDDVLASFAKMFRGSKAQLSYFASSENSPPILKFFGIGPGHIDAILSKYREMALQDPRWPPVLFKAFHCRQTVSEEVLRASAMYRQVLAPAGIEYSLFFLLDLPDGVKCAMSVMRGPGEGTYTASDCDEFGRFIPHVARAVSISDALRRAYRTTIAARELIDGMPLGMMVVNEDDVVLANAAAKSLLERGDALRFDGGRLRAFNARADAWLATALRDARTGPERPIGLTLPAGDDAELRAVIRRLRPISAGMLGAAEQPAVALYLSDSRRPLETPDEILRHLFGLTEREAAVLRTLVRGDDIRGIARHLGIGVETVKTHVRHILQRTGASRRAQLIQLVLSSPAWIAGRDDGVAVRPGKPNSMS